MAKTEEKRNRAIEKIIAKARRTRVPQEGDLELQSSQVPSVPPDWSPEGSLAPLPDPSAAQLFSDQGQGEAELPAAPSGSQDPPARPESVQPVAMAPRDPGPSSALTRSDLLALVEQTVEAVVARNSQKGRTASWVSNLSVSLPPNPVVSSSSSSAESLEEGEIPNPEALSDDEGLAPEVPAFVGLFNPQHFRSLLHKAKQVTGMGLSATVAPHATTPAPTDPSAPDQEEISDEAVPLFGEPSTALAEVPMPSFFKKVIRRQWVSPSTAPASTTLDKKLYNLASHSSDLFLPPSVDAPVAALLSAAAETGNPIDYLRPEEKRSEQSLLKTFHSAAWAIKSASAASFFNRAALMWLKQLQRRLSPSDARGRQDVNKIMNALQFSADASLNSARFSAKAMGNTTVSRRLLWLKNWQGDSRNKWKLASSPISGDKLFGSLLDPHLRETRDKKKYLPASSRKAPRPPPSVSSSAGAPQQPKSFRNRDSFPSKSQGQSSTFQSGQDQKSRSRQFQANRPFRGARGRNRSR